MNSVNICILTGRLGKDPEIRSVGETEVCRLVMATDHSWFSKTKQNDDGTIGGWESETTWHVVEIWKPGKLLKEAKKGQLVHVEGRYTDNIWTGDDGVKHYDKVMKARAHWVIPRGDGQPFKSGEQQPAQQSNTNNIEAPYAEANYDIDPDDLPF